MQETLFFNVLALVVFIVASVSDYLDGIIARKTGYVTTLGKILDPIADKILVLGAFICFVQIHIIPAWMLIIIISRELLITGIRLFALCNGRFIAADVCGKHKTAWQMGVIVFIVVWIVLSSAHIEFFKGYESIFRYIIDILMFIVISITLWSGWRFLQNNREVLK